MRRSSKIASVVAAIPFVVGGLASATLAQDDTVWPTADSPIVGAWLIDVGNDAGTAPTTAVFHADGTYLQTDSGGVGVGSWEATGPNTGALTFTVYDAEDAGGFSSATVRATAKTSEDGASLTGTFTLEQISVDGTSTGQMGPLTATGTRIEIEEMTPLTTMGSESGEEAETGSQTLDVTLADFSVVISPTTAKAGEPITFVVTNTGAEMHELVLEKAGDDDVPLSADGVESEIEDIAPGTTSEMTWTITEPGTYQLACHIPGHYEQGMVATFEVAA